MINFLHKLHYDKFYLIIYQNRLCFSQNQWTFEWGLKISKILQKIFKNNPKRSKCCRKSSKMIDLPLHLPMNTFLKISGTKNQKKITKNHKKSQKKHNSSNKNSKNVWAIPCDARPFGNPVHTIPQSSRISRADLFLCSNLPQLRLRVIWCAGQAVLATHQPTNIQMKIPYCCKIWYCWLNTAHTQCI